jgi:hypothetical protein
MNQYPLRHVELTVRKLGEFNSMKEEGINRNYLIRHTDESVRCLENMEKNTGI